MPRFYLFVYFWQQEEKAKKSRKTKKGCKGCKDMDFIRARCVSAPPPGEGALFCSLPPAQSSCPGQNVLERQLPVETAGQGLSKDNGAFWCADRRIGQTPWCACQSWRRCLMGCGLVHCHKNPFLVCFLHVCSQQLGQRE